jgi:hypothetical protein
MPVKTILWSILVLSTCGRVFRCNYRGVYSGSGHYDCTCVTPKRGDRVHRVIISYPLRGIFIFPSDPQFPVPSELKGDSDAK